VTGVQTCARPISSYAMRAPSTSMSDVSEQIKDSNIVLTPSPFTNIGKHEVLSSSVDVPATVSSSSRFADVFRAITAAAAASPIENALPSFRARDPRRPRIRSPIVGAMSSRPIERPLSNYSSIILK